MKATRIQKKTIWAYILLVGIMSNCAIAIETPLEKNGDYLTIRESLIPMYARSDSEVFNEEQFPLNRINPKAAEYLRFYLTEDNAESVRSAAAIWVLGFIGEENDIKLVEQYVDTCTHRTPNLAMSVGSFVGMMIKREVKGAERFLKKYAKVSSWMPSGEEDTTKSLRVARKHYSYYIMLAYKYSKAPYLYPLLLEKSPDSMPYLHESFMERFMLLKVDTYTELMQKEALPDKKMKENIEQCLERYGEWIDMLMKKQTLAQWRSEAQAKKTVPTVEKKASESYEQINLSETLEGVYLRAVGIEAASVYIPFSGRHQDAKDIEVNPSGAFQVRIDVQGKVDGLLYSGSIGRPVGDEQHANPVVVKYDKKNASVTFNVNGASNILKHYAPQVSENLSLVSTGDEVMVLLERRKNQWYLPPADDPIARKQTEMIEDEYFVNSVNEAIKAYDLLTQMIISGNYNPLTIPVLDNGKLIPTEKREKKRDEIIKALNFEKKILSGISQAQYTSYENFNIKVTLEATLSGGEATSKTNVMPMLVKGFEVTEVTFKVREAAKVYQKHASSRMSHSCKDGKGNLVVFMKRINGKWYWNPFGW